MCWLGEKVIKDVEQSRQLLRRGATLVGGRGLEAQGLQGTVR